MAYTPSRGRRPRAPSWTTSALNRQDARDRNPRSDSRGNRRHRGRKRDKRDHSRGRRRPGRRNGHAPPRQWGGARGVAVPRRKTKPPDQAEVGGASLSPPTDTQPPGPGVKRLKESNGSQPPGPGVKRKTRKICLSYARRSSPPTAGVAVIAAKIIKMNTIYSGVGFIYPWLVALMSCGEYCFHS